MKHFSQRIQEKFNAMCKTGKLFRSSIQGIDLWNLYLKSFVVDPIFRDPESTTHNCNLCNNFIRRYGNLVSINEAYEIDTIFDVELDTDDEYYNVAKQLTQVIKSATISDVFIETRDALSKLCYGNATNTTYQLGVGRNVKRYTKEEAEKFGIVKADQIVEFNHMYLTIDKSFIDTSGSSVDTLMAKFRDPKQVFQRTMAEIPLDVLELVRELILQESLRDGRTHLAKLEHIIKLKSEYDTLNSTVQDNWCWVKSYMLPYAKFKNELLGTFCSDLAGGMDLEHACLTWNKRVDPVNYMQTTAPITSKQKADAIAYIEANGFTSAFDRRYATIADIKASEILHINTTTSGIKAVSLFDKIETKNTKKVNDFKGVEEITIDKFMKDILPTCDSVEAYFKASNQANLVTLTTSKVEDSKPIFKYTNNYSATFYGNIAGQSEIKQAVKSQGGGVDGVLRFSIMWSENDSIDDSDLDAWCIEPNGNGIGFSSRNSKTGGNLDIDITQPLSHKQNKKEVVENITFPAINTMLNGKYKFYVNQFSARNSKGFKAEIEFNGEIYQYEYNKAVSGNVNVAEVTLTNGVFEIKHILPTSTSIGVSKNIYGIDTNEFHKVNLICLSPNHWETAIGNKYYFFMLENCRTTDSIKSFHNEHLIPELLQFKHMTNAISAITMIEPSGAEQLSGLGFNATLRNELLLRITSGTLKRVVKILF